MYNSRIKRFENFIKGNYNTKKIYETDEWNHKINLKHVFDNPDDDCEECLIIKDMYEDIHKIESEINDKNIFEIIDIVGYDIYTGSNAIVKIFNKKYNIFKILEDLLLVRHFPITNNTSNSGFQGSIYEIIELLISINEVGGIKMYNKIKKYNI